MDQKETRSCQTSTCDQVLIFDGQSNFRSIFDILPFPTDASQKCYSTSKSGISVRLASTRKWQELFRMVIIPILCEFIPNLFVHNVNCVANLLRGNLSIINCWAYLEISKISLYPPSICGSRLFCFQIFNLA